MPLLKVIHRETSHFKGDRLGKYKDDDALRDVISYRDYRVKSPYLNILGSYQGGEEDARTISNGFYCCQPQHLGVG